MFVGRDGCTADAEHQQQRWRPIYVVYGPPHGRYARFAMLAMFGASAAEVRALLISSHNFGGFGSVTFASQALPHLLIPGFLHFTWVGTGLGHHFLARSVYWSYREHPQLFTTVLLPIGSLPHRISKILLFLWCTSREGLCHVFYGMYKFLLVHNKFWRRLNQIKGGTLRGLWIYHRQRNKSSASHWIDNHSLVIMK